MSGHNKGKRNAVYMILIGLAIIALEWQMDTGNSYGLVMGENEGVGTYAITQIITAYVGGTLSIDVFFNPLGYALIIAGFMSIGKVNQAKRGVKLSVIGIISNLALMLIPLIVEPEKLILPVIVLHLTEILIIAAIMYALTGICTAKIDNYKYMHIGKDLKFGAELYATCLVIGKVLYLFTRMDWYFSNVLYVFVSLLSLVAMGYYIVKVYGYLRQLEMFETEE